MLLLSFPEQPIIVFFTLTLLFDCPLCVRSSLSLHEQGSSNRSVIDSFALRILSNNANIDSNNVSNNYNSVQLVSSLTPIGSNEALENASLIIRTDGIHSGVTWNDSLFLTQQQAYDRSIDRDPASFPKKITGSMTRFSSRRTNEKKEPIVSDVIPSDGNTSTSIVRYLEDAHYPYMIALLRWNSEGILDRMSPMACDHWSPQKVIGLFNQTRPSKYGKVAFLLGTDVMAAVRWKVLPPIPFLTYSLPLSLPNDNNPFSLIPAPYDQTSFNRACIEHAEQTTLKTPFLQRKNVIIWRGIPHGKSDPNRQILFDMSKEDPNNLWLDAVNIEEEPNKTMKRDEMAQYRYQLDIGGVSGTTWGGLRWKMCSNNLVFKVDSWSRDWWHNTIEPWKHYIPVHYNLSDLRKQYDWAEAHPDQALQIVQQGTVKCKETASEEAIASYQHSVIGSLSPATMEQMKEASAILDDNLGSFYQPILDREEKASLESEQK